MAKMTDRERKNIVKIIKIMKENPTGLWIRELARQSKLHMETARRIIQKYPELFEEYADFTPYRINLKLIKLKNENISEKNFDVAIGL
ncbi:MAG: hypothetical protein GQ477_04600 [Nanohaloarchaea archaeon]|nr:hypothetical protein [Candidatus Nanohaloarchaea archaeon]